MADEKIEKLRNRAYQICESKGRPLGRDLEHRLEAEGELEEADDRNPRAIKEEAGLEAARAYHRDVQEFGRHENVAARAQEAKHAIEGAEASELKRAEAIGKSRGRANHENLPVPTPASHVGRRYSNRLTRTEEPVRRALCSI